jgi:ABC-type glutathione transport system ATPase component
MAASSRYFRDIHETDPDTAACIADRVVVMSAGRIVEGTMVERRRQLRQDVRDSIPLPATCSPQFSRRRKRM